VIHLLQKMKQLIEKDVETLFFIADVVGVGLGSSRWVVGRLHIRFFDLGFIVVNGSQSSSFHQHFLEYL
jgi:hypothetical protein